MQTPSIADLRARGIPFVIREHRINKTEDDKSDQQSLVVSEAMKNKSQTNERHAEWRKLYAIGWTPKQIAEQFEVYESTVRRITGGSQRRSGRIGQRIKIGNLIYENQKDAMKCLRMGRERLLKMLDIGRARYVR